MKAIKFIMLLMITALSSFYFTGCDKGTDTVDFAYYLDANDRRVVHFNAKGKSDYGSFDYSWNFGDGSVGTGKEITHEFADFGTFKIVLYADIDDSNISTSVTKEIEVEIPKITNLDFEITPDKKSPRLYNFRANSNTDYGNVEYSWNFGDGSTASGDNIQYGFEYFGVYNIELLGAISQYDKISSITKKDVLISPPAITRLEIYAEQDSSNPFLYHFKPIAEASWGTLEYEWSFGDGRIALDEEVTNIYTEYSTYRVKVTATIKETGATRTEEKEIEVEVPIFKNYEITHKIDTNDPLQVYFTIENKDGASEDISQQDSFSWEFGDGETASGLRVNHRFESYGEKYIYVTLRTSNQTQKTLTKTVNLETPLIQNIIITGQPSLKAGNLIEYRVKVDSQFEDEIEYEWEFDDGTKKNGRAVTREMSYWPQADATGHITEEIYLRIKIPRLNMSIRNTEAYKVQVLRPTIKNFGINCIRNSQNHLLWTCSPKKDNKNPISSAGGKIEYEWEFDGQTYTGANQKLLMPTVGSYNAIVTARIEDTNITESSNMILNATAEGIAIRCSATGRDPEETEIYLTTTCFVDYDNNVYTGASASWDFGDGQLIRGLENVKHKYSKAGVYNVSVKFNSEQLKNYNIVSKEIVLVNVDSWFDRGSRSGTADCGGWQTGGKYTVYRNNFELFNKADFDITNVFKTRNESCSCKDKGWNKTDNIWHAKNEESASCWGNIDQDVKTTICVKGKTGSAYCVTN